MYFWKKFDKFFWYPLNSISAIYLWYTFLREHMCDLYEHQRI